ncbi:MAG: phosphatidate cytidylyltransferase [Sedimentisphaerales bacterium]|nr:phosphatidate cytidylyltransferase [Sedimentisphaerales bacterium]
MLKHRLFFGTLMTVAFTAIVIFDGWLGNFQLSIVNCQFRLPRGTIVAALIVALVVLGQIEFAGLLAAKNLKAFMPVSIITSAALAVTPIFNFQLSIVNFVLAFGLLGLLLYQYLCCGTSGVLANCGANCFSIIYLGLLSSFALAIRVDFGVWPLLMFVFVVKSSDIGAYAVGTLFGKHKFSPRVSPGKTWEGAGGALVTAVASALAFAAGFDIMSWQWAIAFGFFSACVGQAGDLAESMLKRVAQRKDAANKVPGFGGILDIIDSPLAAAPFAYLFFMLLRGSALAN